MENVNVKLPNTLEFEKAFQHAMSTKGPYLIQAVARRPKM